MFTKGTTLIGTLLALGTAAAAAPAYAASSDGADVEKMDYCVVGKYAMNCREGIVVSNDVQTPAGLNSSSSTSNYTDTWSSWMGGNFQTEFETQTHSHALVQDGEYIEIGQHYIQQTTQISPVSSGPCTDREDTHQVRDNVQYDREVYSCR